MSGVYLHSPNTRTYYGAQLKAQGHIYLYLLPATTRHGVTNQKTSTWTFLLVYYKCIGMQLHLLCTNINEVSVAS